jgi:hypothetical protein
MPHSARRQLVVATRATTLHQHLVQDLHDGDASTPQWLVVPSLRVIDHLRRELALVHGSTPDVRGCTILELAQKISAEARREYQRHTLSPQAGAWMARRFLDSDRLPLGFFDKVLRVRGFRQSLLRSFEELAASGLVSGAAIEKLLVGAPDLAPAPAIPGARPWWQAPAPMP